MSTILEISRLNFFRLRAGKFASHNIPVSLQGPDNGSWRPENQNSVIDVTPRNKTLLDNKTNSVLQNSNSCQDRNYINASLINTTYCSKEYADQWSQAKGIYVDLYA